MLSVHTNYASMMAQNSVAGSNRMLTNAMGRLSTGLRVNSAADDAAGLQIATRLNANAAALGAARRNANDGISLLQTADGALDEISKIGVRLKELVTQAANGVNSADDTAAINSEYGELVKEVTNIITNTKFAGKGVFATLATVNIQSGVDSKLAVAVTNDVGGALKKTVANDAASATEVTDLIKKVGTARSKIGAYINRLEHAVTNLGNVQQNTQAAAGRIMDADFAVESSRMTKNQLLVQSGTNVLARANQSSNLVMGLLR